MDINNAINQVREKGADAVAAELVSEGYDHKTAQKVNMATYETSLKKMFQGMFASTLDI